MYHFDIPKTRQYDTGKIEVIARSSAGEALASTELKVIPRHDDYRGVLKNAPRRKLPTGSLLQLIHNNNSHKRFYTVCYYSKIFCFHYILFADFNTSRKTLSNAYAH